MVVIVKRLRIIGLDVNGNRYTVFNCKEFNLFAKKKNHYNIKSKKYKFKAKTRK